jgi:hypothetical protein
MNSPVNGMFDYTFACRTENLSLPVRSEQASRPDALCAPACASDGFILIKGTAPPPVYFAYTVFKKNGIRVKQRGKKSWKNRVISVVIVRLLPRRYTLSDIVRFLFR